MAICLACGEEFDNDYCEYCSECAEEIFDCDYSDLHPDENVEDFFEHE
jgi:hypothetical protein